MLQKPAVYIFHGDHEFALSQQIQQLRARLGEKETTLLDSQELDGSATSLSELQAAISSIPFFAARRLIVLHNPLARIKNPTDQKSFTQLLERTPESTALILVFPKPLEDKHWLLHWAKQHPKLVYIKAFYLPKGPGMAHWIQEYAQELGGEITWEAAQLMASFLEDRPRLAAQEVLKLLTYVNFERPVEVKEVKNLTEAMHQGNIFELVDALGHQDENLAFDMLHQLLESQDAGYIFAMVVRQFRLLLQAREILDKGGNEQSVANTLNLHSFVGKKITLQARRWDLVTLEGVYRRLLDYDEAIKTGQMPWVVALDMLISELVLPAPLTSG